MGKNGNFTFTQRMSSSGLKLESPFCSTKTGRYCKSHHKNIAPCLKQWLADDPNHNPPKVTIDLCMNPLVKTSTYSNIDITILGSL